MFPKSHIGGRKSRCTKKVLHNIVKKIYAGWNKNQIASLLMLDISGAYNYVCKIRLLHNLRKQRINLKVDRLIKFFLSNKTTTIKTNICILDHLSIQYGIPQGSLLSPIFFLFYKANVLDICSSIIPGQSANAFIDDTSLLAIGPSIKKNCLNLAKAHKKCLKWAQTHGAVFAPSKYQLLHLTHQKKNYLSLPIKLLLLQSLKPSVTGRLLGVTLDSKLK